VSWICQKMIPLGMWHLEHPIGVFRIACRQRVPGRVSMVLTLDETYCDP